VRLASALVAVLIASSAHAEAPPRSTSAGAKEHWKSKSISITLDPSLGELSDSVRAAFGTWLTSDAGFPNVTFDVAKKSASAARDGVSRVLATKNVAKGHERDVAYTVSYADVATGEIVEADIVFNLAYDFDVPRTSCKKVWDAESIATHEVGHFFGLSEDMSEADATMFFETAACDVSKRTLATSDIDAMGALYPRSSAAPQTLVAGCSMTPGKPASGGLPTLAALVVFCMRRKKR
jgi:hypothetical protein